MKKPHKYQTFKINQEECLTYQGQVDLASEHGFTIESKQITDSNTTIKIDPIDADDYCRTFLLSSKTLDEDFINMLIKKKSVSLTLKKFPRFVELLKEYES